MRPRWIGFLGFRFPLWLLILLLCGLCAGVAQAQPPDALGEKNVLILHAHEANAPVFQETDRTLGRTLESGGIPILNQSVQSLDLRRNPDTEYRKLLVEYLRAKYRLRKFDLIITMYPEALHFVMKEGRDLFPEVPILALYLQADREPPKADRRIFRHTARIDVLGTLEIALKLVPGAKRVYVVSGAHEVDRQVQEQARRAFTKWDGRLEFRYLSQAPLEETLTTLASAPREALVLLLPYSNDVTGKSYTTPIVAQRLSEVSTVPIFGVLDVTLGHGIVGGSLISFERIGTTAGRLALDIIGGTSIPENISPVLDVPPVPMFDWRQLKRWNLSVDAVPPGSIVIDREYSLWEQYRWQVTGAVVLLAVQALLILALLVHRQWRRKAEETLRESEERLRLALNAAALGVWSWDIPQGSIRLSEQVGRMLPETPMAEVGYKDVLAIVLPEDRERIEAARQQAIRSRKEYEVEYRISQRDGTIRWIASRGSCTYDRAGAPLRMTGVSHDITERKRSELALQESEQRFRQMADAAPVMVWMSGEDKGCIYFNKRWLDFTGRTMEQERGDGWTAGVHPEDRERCLATYTRAFDARQPFEMEYRLWRCDGEYRWMLDIGVPRFESDGRFAGYIGSCIDITERRRAEEALRTSEAVNSGILTSLAGHMAILDRNGVIIRVNEAWNRFVRENGAPALAGVSVGANYLEVCRRAARGSEPDAQPVLEGIEAVLAGAADEFTLEYPCHAPAEERWFVMRVTPLQRPEGGAVISHVNITARKVAELEAEGVRRDLAHATRVMLMGELAASLAHELNQPLTAILSNAHAGERYLTQTAPPLGEIREILQDVVGDARRAGEVIQRLRSLLRKDEPRFIPLDINQVIREMAVLIHTDAVLRNLVIDLDLGPDLPPVCGDRVQIQQVLLNLVLNGMEAMAQQAEGRRIVVETARAAEAVAVSVRDEGPGIPADKLTRIFETFYTTKPNGMGMGLAISRSIVEAHGGRIWAENNPDRGATFLFTLPVRPQDTLPAR